MIYLSYFLYMCMVGVPVLSFACVFVSGLFVGKTSFLIEWSWHCRGKSVDPKCEGLFLGSQFCCILYISSYASTVQS